MVESAITFTPGEVSNYYAVRVPNLKQRHAAEWRGACRIHNGKDDNFAVESDTGQWFCHSTCGRGGDILDLEADLAGGDFPTRKAEVFRLVGRIEPEYRRNGSRSNGTTKLNEKASALREVARYPYVDRNGNLLYEVIRYLKPDDEKVFRQCRPDGRGGVIWTLDGVERVPYRLPELLKAETVYLPEGEKDVHTLEGWGLVASCNPGGSGSSHLFAGWTDYFRDKHLVILPDNDEPGRKHAAAKADALLGAAASIRIVELPGLPAKGDVTDWRAAGGNLQGFRELIDTAAMLDAAAISKLRARWRLSDEEPHQARAEAGSLILTRRLSDIDAKPVSWLWPGRIARGKVSIIAGNPGLGKSQITANIASIVTTGGCWPVDGGQCVARDVVFLSAEDDPADTLRPRLEAAGADLNRVHVIDSVLGHTGNGQPLNRTFSIQRDMQALLEKLTELGDVAAVFIDPITAYLGDVDSHRNAEVRALLAPLSDLAAQRDTAIIGVSHMNKSAGAEALMRVTGSLAFVAAARAAYLVARDEADEARRFFVAMKNNIGPDSMGLAFRIESATVQSSAGPLQTSRVVWEANPVTITANEAMRTETPEQGSALRDAEEWLRETLSEPTPASEVTRKAEAAGISRITLKRASGSLGVVKQKAAMNAGWVWSLPPKGIKTPEEAQQNCLIPFGNLDPLRGPDEMTEVEI